ncbi:Protein NLRC5 [Liparis tanakae]|uniref:Protein NLRC5 n=1 Tax=Liparis tanakae TaxID=230148 RepID=A0A4Z2HZ60_9TELE|nr:Protein NLRC5 [Liparis tanakae]
MDEGVDREDENVNSVLAQESSQLLPILSGPPPHSHHAIVPNDAGCYGNSASISPSTAAVAEHIEALLEYFRGGTAADCCNFLQSLCLLCEDIPMQLESRLMSVAGYVNSVCEHSTPSVTDGKPSDQLIKHPRIDYWMQYIGEVMHFLQRRSLSERLVRQVQPENVWVGLRTANRGRPDQTTGSADKGGKTPESDGDYGSMDSRVTLESFIQGCTRKGPISSSYLFVLLEFRQLNVLSRPLSLSELLFQHYVPIKESNHGKESIVDYLLSNPEQSCWVLDGYDEFNSRLAKQEVQTEQFDPEKPWPVADLTSGLLNRQLPGCTVMVTGRLRNVIDLEGMSDKVGQLLGWDWHEIKEYVDNFFGDKGKNMQVYLGVLDSFPSRDPDTRGSNDQLDTMRLPQSILSQHRSELCELSWNGLEDSKSLFMEEDISQEVLEFSIKIGLFSQGGDVMRNNSFQESTARLTENDTGLDSPSEEDGEAKVSQENNVRTQKQTTGDRIG